MPFGLGFFAVAGAGAGGGADFVRLETTLLTSDTASVTFSSLGSYSAYKHLQIRATLQDTNGQLLRLTFNNTGGGTDYAVHRLQGDGSSVSSQQQNSTDMITLASLPARGNESNTFMAWIFDILDFSSISKNTTVRVLGGSSQTSYQRIGLYSGLYANTAAITSIKLEVTAGSLTSGSRLSLYGIK